MKGFYTWWLLVCLYVLGGWFLWDKGYASQLYTRDHSMMAAASIVLFLTTTASFGYSYWRYLNRGYAELPVPPRLEAYGFAAELMMVFGLIGTCIGFLIMFGTDLTALLSAGATEGKAVGVVLNGLGTIMIATVVGITTCYALRAQLVLFRYFETEDDS